MQGTNHPPENASEAAAAGLSAHEIRDNNRFLDSLARALAGGSPSAPVPDEPPPLPDAIPGYTLKGEIHRGGHGVVYEAIQLRTKRQVAIKVLLRGATATRRQRQRLEHEAEIIASLRHPGIVTVYDAQHFDDDRYAFAMEYIEGLTLDRWAGGGAPTDRAQVLARLHLFETICDAVAFAHRHGVIHRDLKPANILIDDLSRPHILDFGIAKALHDAPSLVDEPAGPVRAGAPTESTLGAACVTLPGEFAGTPAYASPEQVSGDPNAIDTRTDVYSLGVMLYQLLTGRAPYPCSGSLSEVVHHIERTVPRNPSLASHALDTDIDAIVLRALEKDKEDRYASVSDLQADVRRYLSGEAIEARSDSAWYVFRKSARRHRAPVLIGSAVVLLLAGFASVMTVLYSQKREAEASALVQLRQRELLHGRAEVAAGRYELGARLLWRAHLQTTGAAAAPQRALLGGAIEPLDSYWGLWELYTRFPNVATLDAHTGAVYDMAVAPDGSAIATGGHDGALRVWSFPDLQLIAEHRFESWVASVNFSDDGRRVGAICGDCNEYLVFDAESGEHVSSIPLGAGDVRSVFPNADWGAFLVHFHDSTGQLITPGQAPRAFPVPVLKHHVDSTVFSEDGTLLATSTNSQPGLENVHSTVRVWSVPELKLVAQTTRQRTVSGLLFSGDGASLMWATNRAEIERWDYVQGIDPMSVAHSTITIVQMLWLDEAEGKLITRDWDKAVRVVDLRDPTLGREVAQGTRSLQLRREEHGPTSVFVATRDGRVDVWEIDGQPYELISRGDHRGCHSVAICPNNRMFAFSGSVSGGYGIILRSIDGAGRRIELAGHTELVSGIAFSPDGRFVASSSFDGTSILWDAADGALLTRFNDLPARVSTIAFSPDSNTLAFAGDGAEIVLRDLRAGSVRTLEASVTADLRGEMLRIPSVAFHPDGRRLASAATDGVVRVWDVASGKLLNEFTPGGSQIVRAVCFSPDGSILAAGGDDDAVTLIHLETGHRAALRSHPGDVIALAFGPEGRVLISGDRFGGIMLWDVRESKQIADVPNHPELLMSVAVSSDGMQMVTGSAGSDPEVRLWDLGTYRAHIAGNLLHHAQLVTDSLGHEPANLQAMREWAREATGSN